MSVAGSRGSSYQMAFCCGEKTSFERSGVYTVIEEIYNCQRIFFSHSVGCCFAQTMLSIADMEGFYFNEVPNFF